VDGDTVREANALARPATGIAVGHTGSSGLAGLHLQREGVPTPGATVAVISLGGARQPSA